MKRLNRGTEGREAEAYGDINIDVGLTNCRTSHKKKLFICIQTSAVYRLHLRSKKLNINAIDQWKASVGDSYL